MEHLERSLPCLESRIRGTGGAAETGGVYCIGEGIDSVALGGKLLAQEATRYGVEDGPS